LGDDLLRSVAGGLADDFQGQQLCAVGEPEGILPLLGLTSESEELNTICIASISYNAGRLSFVPAGASTSIYRLPRCSGRNGKLTLKRSPSVTSRGVSSFGRTAGGTVAFKLGADGDLDRNLPHNGALQQRLGARDVLRGLEPAADIDPDLEGPGRFSSCGPLRVNVIGSASKGPVRRVRLLFSQRRPSCSHATVLCVEDRDNVILAAEAHEVRSYFASRSSAVPTGGSTPVAPRPRAAGAQHRDRW